MLKEIIDLKFYELSQKLGQYPFIFNAGRCNGSCNTLADALSRIFVPYKTEDVKLNAVDTIAGVNQSKWLIKEINQIKLTKVVN